MDSHEEVGFLPENPYFYKYLTGVETLRFYGKLCGLSGSTLRDKADELLKLVGLEHAARPPVGRLFEGHVAAHRPCAGARAGPAPARARRADRRRRPAGSAEIRDLIVGFKERGITVLLCSHLLGQVQEICDRIGILDRGVLVREGRLEELISIEDQTEIIFRDAPPALLAEIQALVRQIVSADRLLETRKPQTTLERYFLEVTSGSALARTVRLRPIRSSCPPPLRSSARPHRAARMVKHRFFSPARVWALATNTLTELVRLKIFYFLLIFALLLIGSSAVLRAVHLSGSVSDAQGPRRWARCRSSRACWRSSPRRPCCPRTSRTARSTRSSPSRSRGFEYLLGKLLGVLLLLLISIVLMGVVFAAVLGWRVHVVTGEILASGEPRGSDRAADSRDLYATAFNPNLWAGGLGHLRQGRACSPR